MLFKEMIAVYSDNHTELINTNYSVINWSRGSSVTIAFVYGLNDKAIGVRSLAGVKNFFL
jgi:hypothetical protein